MLKTPIARKWPANSLTKIRAKSIQPQLNDANDWDIQLNDFQPSVSIFHYKDSVIYAAIPHIVKQLEMKKLEKFLNPQLTCLYKLTEMLNVKRKTYMVRNI